MISPSGAKNVGFHHSIEQLDHCYCLPGLRYISKQNVLCLLGGFNLIHLTQIIQGNTNDLLLNFDKASLQLFISQAEFAKPKLSPRNVGFQHGSVVLVSSYK